MNTMEIHHPHPTHGHVQGRAPTPGRIPQDPGPAQGPTLIPDIQGQDRGLIAAQNHAQNPLIAGTGRVHVHAVHITDNGEGKEKPN